MQPNSERQNSKFELDPNLTPPRQIPKSVKKRRMPFEEIKSDSPSAYPRKRARPPVAANETIDYSNIVKPTVQVESRKPFINPKDIKSEIDWIIEKRSRRLLNKSQSLKYSESNISRYFYKDSVALGS